MERYPELVFGVLAIQKGYATREQVAEALRLQEVGQRAGGEPQKIGEILTTLGAIGEAQRDELLRLQGFQVVQDEDLLLGQLAVKNGFLDEDELDEVLGVQKGLFESQGETLRLGEILTAGEFISERELVALLAAQQRLLKQRESETWQELTGEAGPAS